MNTASALRKIGSSVRSRPLRAISSALLPSVGARFDPVFDQCLRQLPEQVGDQQNDDAVEQPGYQEAAGFAAGEARGPDPPDIGEPCDRRGNEGAGSEVPSEPVPVSIADFLARPPGFYFVLAARDGLRTSALHQQCPIGRFFALCGVSTAYPSDFKKYRHRSN